MVRLRLRWCWVELQECFIHELVYLHYGCLVAASVAVVRCREDCHYVFVVAPVEAVHHQLVRATHELETVRLIELLGYVLAEAVAGTSGRDSPTHSVVRV